MMTSRKLIGKTEPPMNDQHESEGSKCGEWKKE